MEGKGIGITAKTLATGWIIVPPLKSKNISEGAGVVEHRSFHALGILECLKDIAKWLNMRTQNLVSPP